MRKTRSSDICYIPKKIDEKTRELMDRYFVNVWRKAPNGRDALFCSPYLKSALDDFPWSAHNIKKPYLKDFSRWYISWCKRGKHKQGSIKHRYVCPVPRHIQVDIVEETEKYGTIKDSFLGSKKFWQIYDQYKKDGINIWDIAHILVSRRKIIPSKVSGNIYFYIPLPTTKPCEVKIGYTRRHPYRRMKEGRGNTSTESAKMIGWILGEKKDEGTAFKYFSEYRCEYTESKEMFVFKDEETMYCKIIEYIKNNNGHIEPHICIPYFLDKKLISTRTSKRARSTRDELPIDIFDV